MAVNFKNVGIIQTMLKESAYTWMCGIKEKLPGYLREFIQSEYYGAYTPSTLYERQYRILEAIMTSKIRDMGNGYEFEIYLDASRVSYAPSFWSSHGVTYYRKGDDADTVFHNMAKGIHGSPEFGVTSGSEMGNAFKSILMNLRQVTGEIDGEEIDTDSLTKYEKACEELGVSLSEVRDGAVQLKEPMQILKELSEEYRKLDESDARRANLLRAVGGKYRANALNAILENYSLYEKMLQDYTDGAGSMATEAEKTANSWEGSLNRLSNTWTDTVGNIVDSAAVISAVNGLNELLSVVNAITDAIGSSATIGLGAGAFGIVKFIENLPHQKVLKIA